MNYNTFQGNDFEFVSKGTAKPKEQFSANILNPKLLNFQKKFNNTMDKLLFIIFLQAITYL